MLLVDDTNEDASSMHGDTTVSDRNKESRENLKVMRNATSRTWSITILLVLMGSAASAIFLYMGISGAKNEQQQNFERRATEFSKEIDAAWDDYEGAIRWTHSECRNWRNDNFTYDDFEALYHYLVYGGLDFFSINWVPNITQAERPLVEEKEGAFWKTIEGAEDYSGFLGQEPDPTDPDKLVVANRSEQPFYFPIYVSSLRVILFLSRNAVDTHTANPITTTTHLPPPRKVCGTKECSC